MPTGSAIQAAAAKRVKRVGLELGGKSAFIVFPDADLDAAVAAATMGVWGASGQVCTAGTRVLLHRDIHDEVLERIVGASRDMRLGSGFDPATQMGPVVSAEQLERIRRYVAIGREEGAELVLGGDRHGDVGFFHQPTVFSSVRNDMRIAQEEIFGPVMSVLPFSSEEEAYEIANDTEYGLAAGVWTSDLARAHRAGRVLRAGTVWVNTYRWCTLGALRRLRALGTRQDARPCVDRGAHADQERLDEGRVATAGTPLRRTPPPGPRAGQSSLTGETRNLSGFRTASCTRRQASKGIDKTVLTSVQDAATVRRVV